VKKISRKEDAVSEIVGEMLMLTMVLIILAVFSSSLSNYLPPPRDPSVTISKFYDGNNVTIYHKGGDPIKTVDLTIIVENSTTMSRLTSKAGGFTVLNFMGEPTPGLFDLGDKINVTGVAGDSRISIATSHAVIYSTKV
jgi:archaeal type IV pilus assembly protein PilA